MALGTTLGKAQAAYLLSVHIPSNQPGTWSAELVHLCVTCQCLEEIDIHMQQPGERSHRKHLGPLFSSLYPPVLPSCHLFSFFSFFFFFLVFIYLAAPGLCRGVWALLVAAGGI